jgi:hypothetical protein
VSSVSAGAARAAPVAGADMCTKPTSGFAAAGRICIEPSRPGPRGFRCGRFRLPSDNAGLSEESRGRHNLGPASNDNGAVEKAGRPAPPGRPRSDRRPERSPPPVRLPNAARTAPVRAGAARGALERGGHGGSGDRPLRPSWRKCETYVVACMVRIENKCHRGCAGAGRFRKISQPLMVKESRPARETCRTAFAQTVSGDDRPKSNLRPFATSWSVEQQPTKVNFVHTCTRHILVGGAKSLRLSDP